MAIGLDLVAVLVWVGVPLGLALVGLSGAIRSRSLPWRGIGYAVAVGGTWLAVVAAVSIVRCPAQDETCGDEGFVGDVGTHLALVIAMASFFLLAGRWKRRRRSDGRSAAQDESASGDSPTASSASAGSS